MKVNRKTFKIAFWLSLARTISVGLSAAAGTMIMHLIGNKYPLGTLSLIFLIVSFILILISEYERELK